MRVLSMDTSSELGTAAVVIDGIVAASIASRVNSQHGETLLPLLDHLLKLAHLRIEDIDLLAVGLGPGSFTGVRIGVATAKGLSLARGTKMVGVRTSRVLGRAASGALRAVVIDAKKDEVFVAVFRAEPSGALTQILEDVHGAPSEVAMQLAALSHAEGPITLLGSALVAHHATFRALLPSAIFLPQAWSAPRGDVLALEAFEAFEARGADDPSALVPVYVRGADAKLPGGVTVEPPKAPR